ncbi:Hypothetical protein AJAP_27920 [Amycolatopsis japonica]|uniref:Uncharacterized protein n=1 Tax=Amycolatopsis japonica TaxID=208439 RepID=A0A075UW81_9PSEU|nr:hypothetical protein [Amycolatopsis japonica]AIG78427.1 Hypothetical protein AJAP_27920 [Amycolatopsis japonica]
MGALEEILPDIRRAAKRVGREWSAVTTAEDVEQEIVLHLLTKDTAEKLADFDDAARGVTLYRIGTQIAAQERIDYDHFTGNYRYSTNDVRKILDLDALLKIRERTSAEEADLDEGMAMLRKRHARYAEVVVLRYRFKENVDRRVLHRAVDALAECMNSVHIGRRIAYVEGPGSRTAFTNDQAQRVSRGDYSGNGGGSRALNPEHMDRNEE